MEDQIYETGKLTYHQKENLKKFLDDVIGTDFEEESFDGGKYTLTVFDLTPKEVRKIREFENTKINEPYEKFCAIWKLKDNDTIYRSGWLDSYDEADDLMANVSTTFGVDKFRAFDFRMVETSIKSEQYRKENVASAKEVSTGDLMRNFNNLLLIDKLWAKEEPIVCDLGCVSIHFKKIDTNARQIEVKSNSREFDYVEYQLDKNYNFEDRKYKTPLEAKEQLSHIYLSVYKELDSKDTHNISYSLFYDIPCSSVIANWKKDLGNGHEKNGTSIVGLDENSDDDIYCFLADNEQVNVSKEEMDKVSKSQSSKQSKPRKQRA